MLLILFKKPKNFENLLTKGNTDEKLILKKNVTSKRLAKNFLVNAPKDETFSVVVENFGGREYESIRQKNTQTISESQFKEKSAIAKVFRKMRFRVFHSNKIENIIRAFLKYWVR